MTGKQNKKREFRVINNNKKVGSASYNLKKKELLELFVKRATLEEIGKELNINKMTAMKWRDWLIEEHGNIEDKDIDNIKKQYIAKTFAEIEMAKEIVIRTLLNNKEDPRTILNMNNCLVGLQKNELAVLTHFNITPTQTINVNHFAGEGIEVVFLDETKVKVIEGTKDDEDI